jgi:hypothetical protein
VPLPEIVQGKNSFVSWVLDGGFFWVFLIGVTLYLGCLLEGFYCILGFMWVLGVVGMYFLMGFLGFFLWAS